MLEVIIIIIIIIIITFPVMFAVSGLWHIC